MTTTAGMRPLRVMYIDGVGPFGGASRSLFEVVRALPAGSIEALFVVATGTVVPLYGQLARDLIATRGLVRFDITLYGFYRGTRWLILLRDLFHLPYTIASLVRAKRRWKHVDVIHTNEVTEIIPALLARWLFRAPSVLHVRSLVKNDASFGRVRWLHDRFRRDLAAVIAIDENVRSTIPADIAVDVIHNSFTPKRTPDPDESMQRKLDALRPGSLKVGFVGNLLLAKGLFDLLAAARIVRASGRDVEFVIVGGMTRVERGLLGWALSVLRLRQNIEEPLRTEIHTAGLDDSFHLVGSTMDIQRVYERIDVLCFPSHYDSPGRPVFEAAFSSKPSIVAVSKPRPDTLVTGETGLAVPMRDPPKLAEAILYFADNRGEIVRMGTNARALAERNFVPSQNATALLALYQRVAGRSEPRSTA